MKEKINKVCNNSIVILGVAVAFSLIGGAFGVLAYYGQWLG